MGKPCIDIDQLLDETAAMAEETPSFTLYDIEIDLLLEEYLN